MACNDRLEKLALYAGGDLGKEAAGDIEEHLAQCESCRSELTKLKSVLRLTSDFSPEIPGTQDFLEGVRSTRARISRRCAFKFAAVAAVLLMGVMLTIPFIRDTGTESGNGTGFAGTQQIEVESVGYDEAVVTIIPAEAESMAVVWIISDEVESK